jgi:hypothetical protein
LAISKKASNSDVKVEAGIKKMKAAWNKGIEFTVTDANGKKRSNSAAIKTACKADLLKAASKAEKFRKYRAMSTRIGKEELQRIFNRCRKSNRAWGPTLLCELSRIPEKEDRERIAKSAIEKGLGLVDLKRMVRLEIGSPKSIKSETARVGRKRTLDWSDPKIVADEIHQVCRAFLTFANDIHRENTKKDKSPGVKKLFRKVIPDIKKTEVAINKLQSKCVVTLPKKSKA